MPKIMTQKKNIGPYPICKCYI